MQTDLPAILIREGFTLLFYTGAPMFAVLLVIGVLIGMVQAATQINDPSFSFLPRILTAGLLVWALGGSVIEGFAQFFVRAVSVLGTGA